MWKLIINSHFFTVIYPLVLVLSVILGAIIARKTWINKKIDWKSSGVDSSVVAIYSLLLSFTFFASNNLMRDRLVILNNMKDYSASIRKTSLFTGDSIQDATKKYLVGYLTILSDFKTHYLKSEIQLKLDIDDLNGHYLSALSSMAKRDPLLKSDALTLIPYINQLNGSFIRFVHSYDVRTPPLIMILLVFSSLLIGILVGFLNSFNNKTHYLVPVIFIVIVSLCIQSIRDLDNPYIGSIQPSFADFSRQLDIINGSR
ncbi:MAG TPA: hypothetical protein VKI61_11555 [Chitinophagaceae bacterium]|jgi:hypothetical protein|nr:hypothetical protein [Chitinophagaceae bacterium]